MRTLLSLCAAATIALSTPASAALVITQDTAIGTARTAFNGAIALDWDAGGAPGNAVGAINIRNWIDGVGFEGFDLAINGVENVTFNFAAPVSRVGFAIATGLGIFPSEVDNLGASFTLLADNGETGVLTLVDTGSGYAAWIEIVSATPFTSLSFTEIGNNIQDQYWGDISFAAVPEPHTWAMMILGLGMAGAAMRRRKRAVRVCYD